jgi:hypothetical protein
MPRRLHRKDAILIAVSREGDFAIAHEFSHLAPGDRALVVLSLERFREGKGTLAAAAQRFLRAASRALPGRIPPGGTPGAPAGPETAQEIFPPGWGPEPLLNRLSSWRE